MPDPSQKISQALIAILKMADEQLNRGLSKTALVKFLYLLDVYAAEETKAPWSGANWRFVHFGPFACEVADAIGTLAQQGMAITTGEDVGADREFTIYRFARHRDAPSLKSLGVPPGAALELSNSIKRFGGDLPRLLDYVYFQTAPMADAEPGAQLDFSGCEPTERASFRAAAAEPISVKKIKRAREILRKATEERAAAQARIKMYWAPLDEAYYAGVQSLNEDSGELPVGFGGRAEIHTRR